MIRRDAPAVALLMATAAGLGAAVYFSAPAHAAPDQADVNYASRYAPAVCTTLDAVPTFDGIIGIANGILEDGFDATDAGYIIRLSIDNMCPRHEALMQRFIDRYTTAQPKQVA